MALAYGTIHELSHQLRFLLFEIGIGLPQNSVDYFITLAHKNTLNRLQYSAIAEGLISSPIASHHVHDFMDQLHLKLKQSDPRSQFFQWNRLRDELNESIANEALTYAYRQRWNSQIRTDASSYDSLWSWLKNEHTTKQALVFLEQWGWEGHPYYASFHAKMGFTRREVLQNSPEFQARISLHWCALRNNKIFWEPKSIDFRTIVGCEFPKEFKLWQEKLIFNHMNPHDYIPFPVHPWQWRNRLQSNLSHLIDNKSLILLPHHQTVMPSMSVDTMMPVGNSNSHIKLSIDIPRSYTSRHDPVDSQYNELISQWITFLLIQSSHYQNTLFLTNKLTDLKVNSLSFPRQSQQQLTVELLQNPVNQVKSDQKVMPLGSLFAFSPISNKPLLIEIIKSSGLSPKEYFRLYCYKVLFSQMHLLLKYGVAFEVQHHNTLVIFTDNMPQGLIMREHEKIKIAYSEYFENKEKPELLSNSRIIYSALDNIGTVFIQGTLQNNLGYWINSLKQEYQISAKQLWHIVYQVLQTIFIELDKEIHPRILCWLKHQILHEVWQHQCFLTMKLKGNTNKNIYITRPNPLYES